MDTIAGIDRMSSLFPKNECFLRGSVRDAPPFVAGIGREIPESRVKPSAVIEVHVTLDASAELSQRNVVLEFDVLVFQRPPEPFHFGVVAALAASVHADGDSELLQFGRELPAGELASLIRIEYLRHAVSAYRELKRLDAMERVHRVHDAVRHVLAAVEVHDGDHERPVSGDSRVCDVSRPDLVRTVDLQILQKVRILFVLGMRLRRIEMRPGIDGPQTALPAQTPYALVIDVIPATVKLPGDAPNPGVLKRFKTEDHLNSYVGLAPHTFGSGENVVVTCGNRKKKQLHYLMIEAAWRAVRHNLEYKAIYGALVGRGMNSKKAIVVIARKLMQTIRAVWLQNRKYVNLMPSAKMN